MLENVNESGALLQYTHAFCMDLIERLAEAASLSSGEKLELYTIYRDGMNQVISTYRVPANKD